MQLMTVVIPKLENLQKEQGEQGRRQLAQVSRVASVVLAIFQSFHVGSAVVSYSRCSNYSRSTLSCINTTIILTSCAVFIMWMGELITERGVGNGASLLIFLGIAARLPVMIKNTYRISADRTSSAVRRHGPSYLSSF
jgi:preprotein translocase subunit SecY